VFLTVQAEQSADEESAGLAYEPTQPAPIIQATPSATPASVAQPSTPEFVPLGNIWSASSLAASRQAFAKQVPVDNDVQETLASNAAQQPYKIRSRSLSRKRGRDATDDEDEIERTRKLWVTLEKDGDPFTDNVAKPERKGVPVLNLGSVPDLRRPLAITRQSKLPVASASTAQHSLPPDTSPRRSNRNTQKPAVSYNEFAMHKRSVSPEKDGLQSVQESPTRRQFAKTPAKSP
jgi:hypothetical protein